MIRNYFLSRPNGEICVVSCITRRRPHSRIFLGKFTYWPTKEAYDKGDCMKMVIWRGVIMGDDESMLEYEGFKQAEAMVKTVFKLRGG